MKAGSVLLKVFFAVTVAGMAVGASLVLENVYDVPNAPVLVLGGTGLAVLITLVFAVYSSAKPAPAAGNNLREQSLISQPLVLQKPVYSTVSLDRFGSGYFSHFLVINAGNDPAVELSCTVSSDKKTPLLADRATFLRPGEEKRVIFNLTGLEKGQYYFITDYLRVSPVPGVRSYARTCLPFEVNKSGQNLQVTTAKTIFEFNLSEGDRIDAAPETVIAV